MASTRQTRWVIFAFPQQYGGRPNHYYARDGTITTDRLQAARFDTEREARAFADRMNIALSALSAIAHIGQEDFTDFEIQTGTR